MEGEAEEKEKEDDQMTTERVVVLLRDNRILIFSKDLIR
jgi:hypothetical protein